MSEQLELFPDSQRTGDAQKRTQLTYLLGISDRYLDQKLILDAWHAHTGQDIIATLRQQLSEIMDCHPDELPSRLHERKLQLEIGKRIHAKAKKLSSLSVSAPLRNAETA